MKTNEVTRRRFLQSAAFAGAASLAVPAGTVATPPVAKRPRATVSAYGDANIIDTTYGRVRGSERDGIHIFRGIPYGADTGGKARFLPAAKPPAWTGVRSSLWYGPVCPQQVRAGWAQDEAAFITQWDDGYPTEDCLRVNVWTPGINDNRKRAVLVWMHGGGYVAGSGQELPSYEGERLSRRGNMVVVSFNHRLNIFGHLNVSSIGPAYASSGNVGLTDIVLLLQWVRDNIANFGGDPGKVTIAGQSGGGSKVSSLMAMPSAQGLFHRAIAHSSSNLRLTTTDWSEKTGIAMLRELRMEKPDLAMLQTMPVAKLVNASVDGLRGYRPPPIGTPVRPGEVRLGFSPYVDGSIVPEQPFDPVAPAISANIPMMIGTVLNEFTTGLNQPDAFSMTESQLIEKLRRTCGDMTPQVLAAFRAKHPGANPFQLDSIITTARVTRHGAVIQSQRKSALGAASVYNWWFQWQTPILDGRPMAFHVADIAFFFDNTARCETATGDTPEAQQLAAQMADSWIAFANTGNPNHRGIPRWDPVTPTGSESMIFDTETRFARDSDEVERRTLHEAEALNI